MALPAVFTLLVLPAWLKPEAVESLSEWVAPRSLLPPKLGCVGKAPELEAHIWARCAAKEHLEVVGDQHQDNIVDV